MIPRPESRTRSRRGAGVCGEQPGPGARRPPRAPSTAVSAPDPGEPRPAGLFRSRGQRDDQELEPSLHPEVGRVRPGSDPLFGPDEGVTSVAAEDDRSSVSPRTVRGPRARGPGFGDRVGATPEASRGPPGLLRAASGGSRRRPAGVARAGWGARPRAGWTGGRQTRPLSRKTSGAVYTAQGSN